jgi:hypothetical protein
VSNFTKICQTTYAIHGQIHLEPYVNEGSLWINMAENRKCPKKFRESPPYGFFFFLLNLSESLGDDSRSRIDG